MWKLFLIGLIFTQRTKSSLDDFEFPKYGNALTQSVTDVIANFYLTFSATVNFVYASDGYKSEEKQL